MDWEEDREGCAGVKKGEEPWEEDKEEWSDSLAEEEEERESEVQQARYELERSEKVSDCAAQAIETSRTYQISDMHHLIHTYATRHTLLRKP